MNVENLIPIPELCSIYEVEISFFINLNEMGLLEIKTVNSTSYINAASIDEIEKMIRLHQELAVNTEGIDVVLNLLKKMDELQNELNSVKNRLRLYES